MDTLPHEVDGLAGRLYEDFTQHLVLGLVVQLKFVAIIVLPVLLAGCSRWDLPPVPVSTAYNLDGTGAAAKPVRREQVRRSISMAHASIETTGSIPTGTIPTGNVIAAEDQEDVHLAQIMKLPANSPEWLALRKQIEQDRIAKNKRELARITICNC